MRRGTAESTDEASDKIHRIRRKFKKIKRKSHQKKSDKQTDESLKLVRSIPVLRGSNSSRGQQIVKIKHRTASTFPEKGLPLSSIDRSASDTTTLSTVTGRDETETADSPSTSSSGSRKKTKVIKTRKRRNQLKNHLNQNHINNKAIDDNVTPSSYALNPTQTSTLRQVIKGERGPINVLLTQEDSQTSQISNAEGEIRIYETRMQKRVKEFVNYCIRTSVEALIAQYEQIQAVKPSKTKAFIGMLPVNHHKNRYIDVYCLDSTRVILRQRGRDYIHANYVRHKVLQNDFILTQAPNGPLPNTVSDFWEMVWQERSGLIFMLCKYVEEHKVKCAEYLPTLQTRVIMHAGIRIELRERSTSKKGNIIMTQLLLSRENANLTVLHYQWLSWADHMVPANDYKTPFYLLKKSRVSPTCTVVHCSAGVGRSGTLVAIELCLMQLVAGNELVVSDMVTYMRRKRAQSVQSKEQYLYIFRALLDFAVSNHIICERKINPFIERYRQICHFDET